MRRMGMKVGLSQEKLAEAMYVILMQLEEGTTELKETIIFNLGMYGQMASAREINSAWLKIKKRAAKEFPDRFFLDQRGALKWNDGTTKIIDTNISAANFRKLNELAEAEKCDVNKMVTMLIKHYKKHK